MEAENRFNRWEASATVAINTNWFTDNITSKQTGKPTKFTLLMMVPTSTVVEVDITDGTTNKTGDLNGGTALTAAAWYVFTITVPEGWSFNIQHATGTQNVACIVNETPGNSEF